MESMAQTKIDWPECVMHVVFGTVFGFALSGVVVWWFAEFFHSFGWLVVGVTTVVFAGFGGYYKDRFWKAVGNNPLFRLWSRIFS
jgi:hypothetical protein